MGRHGGRPSLKSSASLILTREEYGRRIGNRCGSLKRHQLTRSLVVYTQGLESIVPN